MTLNDKQRTANSSCYKKLAVQSLNEALCFVSSFVVADSLVLRNRQLLVVAKHCSTFKMKTISLGNIDLHVDVERTRKFYSIQNGFICDCPDCTNYVNNIPKIQNAFNGIDKELGIDLYKSVGQGMDELMPNDYEDSHFDVIPYYVVGQCFIDNNELEKQYNIRSHYKFTDELSMEIVNTSGDIEINDAENVLTIWLLSRTETKKKKNKCSTIASIFNGNRN